MNRRVWRIAVSLIALVILIAVAKYGSFKKATPDTASGGRPFQTDRAGSQVRPPQVRPPEPTAAERAPQDRLSTVVSDASEREQVETTLALIASNGPFPHSKDGALFANREGRLPRKQRGYYREYTVETPEASNRGARRIIRGVGGETYYTRDHYGTFVRIDAGGANDR